MSECAKAAFLDMIFCVFVLSTFDCNAILPIPLWKYEACLEKVETKHIQNVEAKQRSENLQELIQLHFNEILIHEDHVAFAEERTG